MSINEQTTILVTGASGRTGGQVLDQLSAAGALVRAATRHPETLPETYRSGAVALDMNDPDTVGSALDDVDAVFLMWPFFEDPADTREKVAQIASILGGRVRNVVYLSSQTVERESDTMWGAVEEAISAEVGEWTMLRPTGFARNAEQWLRQIAESDVVRFPFAEMARPLIHEHDIAAAAVQVLLNDGHNGRRYVLSGPELVSQRRQVELLGEASGRALRFEEIDRDVAERDLDLPSEMLEAWASFIDEPEPVTEDVKRLTGRAPQTFATWAADNASIFR